MNLHEVLQRGQASMERNEPAPAPIPQLEEPAQLTLFPMPAEVPYAVNTALGIACPCASPAIADQLNEFFSRQHA